jgi:hypothetical protein
MHEAPYWTSRRVRRMARTAGFNAVVVTAGLAAGIAAGVATATYEHGTINHGPSKLQQPGVGAVFVGFSVAMLVFATMRIGYVLHERRRKPNKVYRTRYESGLTRRQYLRRLGSLVLALAALCCLGLWLRHRYG